MFVGQDLGGLYHFEVDTNSSISILELEIDPLISIYPNPTSESINLSSEHALEHFNLYNMSGEMILESEINATETVIDLSTLPRGLYFMKIQLKDGRLSTKKVIKR